MENSILTCAVAVALSSLCCTGAKPAAETTASKLLAVQGLGGAWNEAEEQRATAAPHFDREARANLWMEPTSERAEHPESWQTPKLDRFSELLYPSGQRAAMAWAPSQQRQSGSPIAMHRIAEPQTGEASSERKRRSNRRADLYAKRSPAQ